MNKELITIFDINRHLIASVDNCIMLIRQQNYDRGIRKFHETLDWVEKLLINYEKFSHEFSEIKQNNNSENLLNLLPFLLQAQENRDYVLLCDLLELQLRSFVIELQSTLCAKMNYVPFDCWKQNNLAVIKKVNPLLENLFGMKKTEQEGKQEEYICEVTASGYNTIKCMVDNKEFYLHSNNNPQLEGEILANTWYSEEKREYVVYGLGMGYHIKQLCALDSYIKVEVYEDNLEIIKLAAQYGDLYEWMGNGQVKLVYDPDYQQFGKRLGNIGESTEVVVHSPSLRLVKEESVRNKMEEYFMHYQSIKNQKGIMVGNFNYNTKHYDASVDVLQETFKNKDIYIIAAGPSLDHNYEELRNIGEDGIILATGTVYRKLVKAGISPDYAIITDANARIIGQLEGVENESIPMILLSTAYLGFAKICKGKKYLACQKEFSLAEHFAEEKGYHLYETGGSVTTTALDVAIRLGGKRIIFVGLDLAYPNNLVHAAGTSRRNLHEDDELKEIEDIHGNMIKTSKHLDMYRRWIEERIARENDLVFIDATEGGAKVNGTILRKLSEVVKELN